MLITSTESLDHIFKSEGLRYTEIPSLIKRYSVEVPYASVQKFSDFFKNLSGVSSVVLETSDKPSAKKFTPRTQESKPYNERKKRK